MMNVNNLNRIETIMQMKINGEPLDMDSAQNALEKLIMEWPVGGETFNPDNIMQAPVTELANKDKITVDGVKKYVLFENLVKSINAYNATNNPPAEPQPSFPTTTDEYFDALEKFATVEMRRNHYRGRNLGSTMTTEQAQGIKDGTFKGLFVGDYWVVNGKKYIVADFNYYGAGLMKASSAQNYFLPNHLLLFVPPTADRKLQYISGSPDVTLNTYDYYHTNLRMWAMDNGILYNEIVNDLSAIYSSIVPVGVWRYAINRNEVNSVNSAIYYDVLYPPSQSMIFGYNVLPRYRYRGNVGEQSLPQLALFSQRGVFDILKEVSLGIDDSFDEGVLMYDLWTSDTGMMYNSLDNSLDGKIERISGVAISGDNSLPHQGVGIRFATESAYLPLTATITCT